MHLNKHLKHCSTFKKDSSTKVVQPNLTAFLKPKDDISKNEHAELLKTCIDCIAMDLRQLRAIEESDPINSMQACV